MHGMADTRPLIDRIGEDRVNGVIGIIYIALWGWGLATFLLIPIHSNVGWPIGLALAYNIVVAFVHFGFIGLGAALVPDYTYYPVEPSWLYMITDGVMFFAFVGVVASYLLTATSSAVPLVATWTLLFALAIHLWKLYSLLWGSARKKVSVSSSEY